MTEDEILKADAMLETGWARAGGQGPRPPIWVPTSLFALLTPEERERLKVEETPRLQTGTGR